MNIEDFAEYLRANDCEILAPTNAYEALRYKRGDFGVVVVYRKLNGRLTLNKLASEHAELYQKGKPLTTYKRAGIDHKRKLKKAIKERDGDLCCFCGQFLDGDETLEHWLPIAHGGTNHISNCALAHERCNYAADNLSIMEKIALRDRLREQVSATPPWEFMEIAA